MSIKSYVFNIEQQCKYLTEDKIKEALEHKTIKQYAYVLHDKDIYLEVDIIKEHELLEREYNILQEEYEQYKQEYEKTKSVISSNEDEYIDLRSSGKVKFYKMSLDEFIINNEVVKNKLGEVKPSHWHVVIKVGSKQQDVNTIAKWFGIEAQYIQVPKGAGAFLDCIQYLTHEDEKQQKLGKHFYSDNEIIANFNFRDDLNKRLENRAKYGKDITKLEAWKLDLMHGKKSLKECREEDDLLYVENKKTLETAFFDYLENEAPMPTFRVNFYIDGEGGHGKGLTSKALARSLYPNIKDDKDIFFPIGAKNVTFDGYRGQPVIIWNEFRAVTFLDVLGGRENVFEVLDPHPEDKMQNIKYGKIRLTNCINIINSVESYDKFLNGLSGEYIDNKGAKHEAEDKKQAYRRVPFILRIRQNDFDLLVNQGYFGKTYFDYEKFMHIRANMERLAKVCGNDREMIRMVNGKAMSIPIAQYNKLIEAQKPLEVEDFDRMFEELGTIDTPVSLPEPKTSPEPPRLSEPKYDENEHKIETEKPKKVITEPKINEEPHIEEEPYIEEEPIFEEPDIQDIVNDVIFRISKTLEINNIQYNLIENDDNTIIGISNKDKKACCCNIDNYIMRHLESIKYDIENNESYTIYKIYYKEGKDV